MGSFIEELVKAGSYSGDLLSFLVWTSPIAGLSLAGLSIVIEGSSALLIPMGEASVELWAIIAWQAFANTLYGYSVWNLPAATCLPASARSRFWCPGSPCPHRGVPW